MAAGSLALARRHHGGGVLDALSLHHAGLVGLRVLMQLELVPHDHEVSIVLIECQVLLHDSRKHSKITVSIRYNLIGKET